MRNERATLFPLAMMIDWSRGYGRERIIAHVAAGCHRREEGGVDSERPRSVFSHAGAFDLDLVYTRHASNGVFHLLHD